MTRRMAYLRTTERRLSVVGCVKRVHDAGFGAPDMQEHQGPRAIRIVIAHRADNFDVLNGGRLGVDAHIEPRYNGRSGVREIPISAHRSFSTTRCPGNIAHVSTRCLIVA